MISISNDYGVIMIIYAVIGRWFLEGDIDIVMTAHYHTLSQ